MKINVKARYTLIATMAVGAALFFVGRRALLSSRFQPPRDFDILATAVRHVQNDYLETVDPRRTMTGAFEGLIGSLDAMSSYLDKTAADKYAARTSARFNDIGLALFKRTGAFPIVVHADEGSPAEKAGLKFGDYVSALDDRSTLAWSLNEVVWYLKDLEKKPVKVRFIRENSTSEMTIERALLPARAVSVSVEKGMAAVIRVHHLDPGAAAEAKAAVAARAKSAAGPLVLDLRGCREGEVDEARAVLNLFLKTDKAGWMEKKGGVKEMLACPDEPAYPAAPLVVWVDPGTMGPAEILAGALKDLKRAKIVGTSTPGLASRQDLFLLPDGDAVLLTTGVFTAASGEKIWGKGVTPDVKLEADQLDRKTFIEKTAGLAPGR